MQLEASAHGSPLPPSARQIIETGSQYSPSGHPSGEQRSTHAVESAHTPLSHIIAGLVTHVPVESHVNRRMRPTAQTDGAHRSPTGRGVNEVALVARTHTSQGFVGFDTPSP
jgi:hypothetical protein